MYRILLLSLLAPTTQEGRIGDGDFVSCRDTGVHIAVQGKSDFFNLVHFHAKYRGMKDKTAYARLIVETRNHGQSTLVHKHAVSHNDETWAYTFVVPRFHSVDDDVTYQVDFGRYSDGLLDLFDSYNSFSYQLKNGKLVTGEGTRYIVRVSKRVLVQTDTGFLLRTVMEQATREGIRGAVVQDGVKEPKDPASMVFRIFPPRE